jgi:hypothetical protein
MNTLPDIRHFQLSTGTSIIAYVTTVNETTFTLEIPFEVVITEDSSGESYQTFKAYMNLSSIDNYIRIDKCNIICESECLNAIKYQYIMMVDKLSSTDESEDILGDDDYLSDSNKSIEDNSDGNSGNTLH